MLETLHMQFIGEKIEKYLFKTSNKDTRTVSLCSAFSIVDFEKVLANCGKWKHVCLIL